MLMLGCRLHRPLVDEALDAGAALAVLQQSVRRPCAAAGAGLVIAGLPRGCFTDYLCDL